jgi:alkylation response protein AidB-like acyl-CoA dehydrogenase
MDFEFSAEQEALRTTVRRFLADAAPIPYVRQQLADRRGTSDEVWKGLVDVGLLGLLVPEAWGGAGRGMVDMGVVLEEMGRAVHPGPFASSAVGAVSALVAVGSEFDRDAWLPSLCDGSAIGTLALFEEGGRFFWREPATTAHPSPDGWRISGGKGPAPDADAADLLLVSAATDDGVGLFAVEPHAAGLAVEPLAVVDGTRKQARLTLDQTPAARVGVGDATDGLSEVVDRLLIALVVDAVGCAEQALQMAVEHAKQRVQFDKPIGAFQAVQHLCAEMLQSVEMARAGAYYALWAADSAPPEERHRAATMAKAFAGEALFRVGANAIQVLGGIGFTWEHDAHLYYKRLISLHDLMGTPSEHLEELATLIV